MVKYDFFCCGVLVWFFFLGEDLTSGIYIYWKNESLLPELTLSALQCHLESFNRNTNARLCFGLLAHIKNQ